MINNKPSSAIPEVVKFEKVSRELDRFKQDNADFFATLAEITDRYNAALQAADSAVRTAKCSCGPFQLAAAPIIKWNAEKLYTEMGSEFFFSHGGSTSTKVQYMVDKNVIAAAFVADLIPKEVLDEVRKEELRYHKPEVVKLP